LLQGFLLAAFRGRSCRGGSLLLALLGLAWAHRCRRRRRDEFFFDSELVGRFFGRGWQHLFLNRLFGQAHQSVPVGLVGNIEKDGDTGGGCQQ